MHSLKSIRRKLKRAIGSSKVEPVFHVSIVDDDPIDADIIRASLVESCGRSTKVDHYTSISDFLADGIESPDVVVLDRMMPDSLLGEARIREIRARHNQCGVVLCTGMITPSLRSTAAHEGAAAVIEKGALDPEAFHLVLKSAAIVSPKLAS